MRLLFLIPFLLLPTSTFAIPISLASYPHASLERNVHPIEHKVVINKAASELHDPPAATHHQSRGLFGLGKGAKAAAPKGKSGWTGVLPYLYNKLPEKKPAAAAAAPDHWATLGIEKPPGVPSTPAAGEPRLPGQPPRTPKFKPDLATIKESKKEGQ